MNKEIGYSSKNLKENHKGEPLFSYNKPLNSFKELSEIFDAKFNIRHFPESPKNLYDAAQYLIDLGGKRVRPVLCLMGNQLFDEIKEDAYHVATAIELFHNFTLIHDDIMDRAPLRRGMETVHKKYGESTALLSGDVMLVAAYEYLNQVSNDYLHRILDIFNETAKRVCEGQQLDMDFEARNDVEFEEYVDMIGLKTSVLLASSLQMGAIMGGAGTRNQMHLYEFGKNLGIAFQIQDDYLDAFGNPEIFGKKSGGDIIANKKTFLLLKALKSATPSQLEELNRLLKVEDESKVDGILDIYKQCNVDEWAKELKQKYLQHALHHLEETAVISVRKQPLEEFAHDIMERKM